MTGGTATEYFSRLTNNKLLRARKGQLPGITEQDCLDPELESAPFAIDHGDLAPQNIIVDSSYNIKG
jgi:hypothetical protein